MTDRKGQEALEVAVRIWGEGQDPTPAQEAEIARLRGEVISLRIENDWLRDRLSQASAHLLALQEVNNKLHERKKL